MTKIFLLLSQELRFLSIFCESESQFESSSFCKSCRTLHLRHPRDSRLNPCVCFCDLRISLGDAVTGRNICHRRADLSRLGKTVPRSVPASVSGVAKTATPVPTAVSQPRPQLQPFVRSTATPSGAWMWDPNRRSVLDRPTPKQTRP